MAHKGHNGAACAEAGAAIDAGKRMVEPIRWPRSSRRCVLTGALKVPRGTDAERGGRSGLFDLAW